MKNNIYNIGLSDANLTKIQLAKRIKKIVSKTKIKIIKIIKIQIKEIILLVIKKLKEQGIKLKYL